MTVEAKEGIKAENRKRSKKTKWLNFQFEKKLLVDELTVEAEEGTKNESKKRGTKKLYNIFEESENLMCQKHLMCQKKC